MFTLISFILNEIQDKMTFFHFFRNYPYLDKSFGENDKKYLKILVSRRFGVDDDNSNKYIFNSSNVTLTEIEVLVLSRGLDLCIPSSEICKEQIFTGFEILYFELIKHVRSYCHKCPATLGLGILYNFKKLNRYSALIVVTCRPTLTGCDASLMWGSRARGPWPGPKKIAQHPESSSVMLASVSLKIPPVLYYEGGTDEGSCSPIPVPLNNIFSCALAEDTTDLCSVRRKKHN